MKTARLMLLFTLLSAVGNGQTQAGDSVPGTRPATVRMQMLAYGGGALYVVSLACLNSLWYAGYPRSSFHFFNDNNEWMKMDKAGHIVTSYYLGRAGYGALKWAGSADNKALIYGASFGFLYLTGIEILDGFSSQWGFSWGDEIANFLGTSIFTSQQIAWGGQRLALKFSFHQTEYAKYRTDQLGSDLAENILKDYNGQTYWMSANLRSFLPRFIGLPAWLNLAVGYGAEGMLGAVSNPVQHDGVILPEFERSNRIYLSPDIDLTRIHVRSKALKTLFGLLGFLKVPSPAACYIPGKGWIFYTLFF